MKRWHEGRKSRCANSSRPEHFDFVVAIRRRILQDIKLGKKLPHEKILDSGPLKGIFQDELSEEELRDLAFEHFYNWIGPYDYVEGLYEVGALVARIGSLPEFLSDYLHEVRQCYVFQ